VKLLTVFSIIVSMMALEKSRFKVLKELLPNNHAKKSKVQRLKKNGDVIDPANTPGTPGTGAAGTVGTA
jgi:hypothetical protein